ncbi:MAG: superoxide dismutase family protein [Proteobacteria bacterium]|nr:superoxide dismutase family protein [Pseudomonadota bacterium]
MRTIAISALLPTIVVLAGCAAAGSSSTAANTTASTQAHATLEARSGSKVAGTLQLSYMDGGVHVSGQVSGLAPNSDHGFHIHEKGDCSAADASSAGGHFNPTAQPHGKIGSSPHHLGDQMNIHADANGVAMVDAHFAGVSLGSGQDSDVMGRALVVHAAPDDYTSQPAGNAGKRVACGVITK